jgi:hypothetical protein
MKSTTLLSLENLNDYKICEGYFLELYHRLMGQFPALTAKDEEPFVCLTKSAVEKAAKLLSKRQFKVNKILLIINEKEHIAFCLSTLVNNFEIERESESLAILSDEDLDNMKVGDLRWAIGLISDDMPPEEFEETLRVALSKV